jgi:hypothetical protein
MAHPPITADAVMLSESVYDQPSATADVAQVSVLLRFATTGALSQSFLGRWPSAQSRRPAFGRARGASVVGDQVKRSKTLDVTRPD